MKKIYLSISCAVFLSFSFLRAQPTTTTFTYTGAMQTFVVPACITSIDVDMTGGEGGGNMTAPGGGGGRVQATIAVTPGQTLNIFVGGQGDPAGTAGYNGGGTGIGGTISVPGGGGGGGTDIRIGGTTLNDRVIVAGGGGGGTDNGGPASGGAGGGLIGGQASPAANPWACTPLVEATGGTQSSGGLGGTSSSCAWNGFNGSFGIGGNSYNNYRCAGGGGGWYGGGGAHNGCGGAGGSSYTNASCTGVIHTQGFRTGNGYVTLTYAPGPASPGTVSGSSSICAGSTGNYSIAPVSGATSYTWNVPAGTTINSGQGTTSINITAGSTSGNITVNASNVCGTSANQTFTLTINALPTVTASGASSAICTGSSDVLTASGASTYVWSSGGTASTETVSPTAMTTYTVTGTDANGCVNTATVSVNVNPLPTVTASAASSAICMGSSDVLTAGGATNYAWSSGGNAATETVSPTSMTTYTVTGTDANGCVNTATVSVNVNSLPVVNLGADVTQCGGSVTLDAGNPGSTYLWSDATVMQTNTVSTSGTYSVAVTDANGCMNSDTVDISINTLPTVDLGNDVTQCGGTVTLDAGNPGSAYMWSTGDTIQMISVSTSGTYYVNVNDPNGCNGSDTVVVVINTPPTVTGTAANNAVCVNDGLDALTGTPAGGTWSGVGVTGSSFDPTVAGTGTFVVSYMYTDSNNCSGTSQINIVVNGCAGLSELSLADGMNIFPNPNNGSFTLFINANVGDVKIEMMDLQGRIISSSVENNVQAGFAKQISTEGFANGTYLLRLTSDKEVVTQKISVQK